MAAPVFLSYAWEDEVLADRLEALLRLRGVPVWRDRRGMRWGAYNEEVVLEAIEHRCSGFVVLLTDAAMDSDFILDIEMPAVDRRRSRDARFFAGAVFARDCSITQASRELRDRTGVELGSALGSPFSAETAEEDLHATAVGVLRNYLRTALAGDNAPPSLHVETRSLIPEEHPATLHLAWSPPLTSDAESFDEHVWEDELLPALADVRAGLEETTASRELAVAGRPHLSAALVLGYEFRAPTGWTLALEQAGMAVRTARVEPDSAGWTVVRQPCSSNADQRAVLCLHATKDVTRAMREHCRALPPARVELHVRPPEGPGHLSVSGDAVNGLAAAMEQAVSETRTRYGVTETHLYLACPWAMAATLGWHLSSVGRLVSHEADVDRSSYRAACRLS